MKIINKKYTTCFIGSCGYVSDETFIVELKSMNTYLRLSVHIILQCITKHSYWCLVYETFSKQSTSWFLIVNSSENQNEVINLNYIAWESLKWQLLLKFQDFIIRNSFDNGFVRNNLRKSFFAMYCDSFESPRHSRRYFRFRRQLSGDRSGMRKFH